jgi:pectinesterase
VHCYPRSGNTHRWKFPTRKVQENLMSWCREKVRVPITKPFVSLIGMGTGRTVITWNSRASDVDASGHQVGTFNSASVAIEADYFCASHITFEVSARRFSAQTVVRACFAPMAVNVVAIRPQNSAPRGWPGAVGQQAVALRLSGDKTMLYRCRVLGTQDTLFDNIGRHYFYNCDIQGSIDFISGDARSLYQVGREHSNRHVQISYSIFFS